MGLVALGPELASPPFLAGAKHLHSFWPSKTIFCPPRGEFGLASAGMTSSSAEFGGVPIFHCSAFIQGVPSGHLFSTRRPRPDLRGLSPPPASAEKAKYVPWIPALPTVGCSGLSGLPLCSAQAPPVLSLRPHSLLSQPWASARFPGHRGSCIILNNLFTIIP